MPDAPHPNRRARRAVQICLAGAALILLALLLTAVLYGQDCEDIDLTGEESGEARHETCGRISAGQYRVTETGDVELVAGEGVELRDGVEVEGDLSAGSSGPDVLVGVTYSLDRPADDGTLSVPTTVETPSGPVRAEIRTEDGEPVALDEWQREGPVISHTFSLRPDDRCPPCTLAVCFTPSTGKLEGQQLCFRTNLPRWATP